MYVGNKSRFVVMLSMEVSSGFLSTNLPAELISTTELKLKSSYQWQPVQTFVTISKHFAVKAKGIRFRGTLDDCNSIMEQLVYHHVCMHYIMKLSIGIESIQWIVIYFLMN